MNVVSQLNTSLAGRYEVEREIGAGGMLGGGPRFVMLEPTDTDLQVVVVSNWLEELKAKMAKR